MKNDVKTAEVADSTEVKVDAAFAKIRKLETKQDMIVKALERNFGIDIDRDGKIGSAMLNVLTAIAVVVTCAGIALGITQSTNTRWNVADEADASSDIIQLDKNGNLTVKGTITSVNGAVTQATILVSTLISNATLKVYGSNVEVVAGGSLTVGAGGTITVPADSVSLDAVSGITATAAEINLLTAYKATQIGSVVSTIATNANGGTNVVTFTCKDLAGTQMVGYNVFRFWIADSEYGIPAAVAGDVVISGTGAAEILQEVDKAVYVVQASNGVAIATITDTPGGTNWIHVQLSGGKVSTPVKSAFNVP